jgi:hypothetical protein
MYLKITCKNRHKSLLNGYFKPKYYHLTMKQNIVKTIISLFQFDSKHGPFFYSVQYKKCTELIIVPIHYFVRLADSAKQLGPKIVLLSNMGRCGSTLLTQMFEAIPGTITISEPSFMSGLFKSDWKSNFGKNVPFSRPQLLAAGFKLQCKTLKRYLVCQIYIIMN